MAWSRINNTETEMTAYASTHTFSHTVSAGDNRLLIVSVGMWDSGDYVTGVTYGGNTLTEAVKTAVGTIWKSSIWYRIAPTVGTANVVLTFGGGDTFVLGLVAGATTFTGIDQTTALRTGATGTQVTPDVSATNPYVDVPNCVTNDLVYGVVIRNGSVLTSVDTEDWLELNDTDNEIGGGVYATGTTGTVQLNWSHTGTQQWAAAGAAFISSIDRKRVYIT